ncbi:MAG: M3 family metallopeptidase, partial [Pseudomonadota bacterium]
MRVRSALSLLLSSTAVFIASCADETTNTVDTVPAKPPQMEAPKLTQNVIEVTEAELEGNPFLVEWETPYSVPPFDAIEDAHFMPAIKAGIIRLREEVAAIVAQEEEPTFANTVVALEVSGELLSKVSSTFGNITSTDTNDTLRTLEGEIYPILTSEYDAIRFNDDLFGRIKKVYEQKDELGLDEQDARLLELTYREFVRAGADLDTSTKARVAEINSELSSLTTEFAQNLLTATTGFQLELTSEEDLSGLSESFKAAIKDDDEDKWLVGLNRSPFETFMTQSTNRELRQKLFDAYRLRASGGDDDNGPLLVKIAQLRAERAELMGYKSHAHYQLEPRMAKTPEAAEAFLLKVWAPGLARAKEELGDIQALINEEGNNFTAAGHDWWHYAEKVRQARYAFDDALLAPYFELGA